VFARSIGLPRNDTKPLKFFQTAIIQVCIVNREALHREECTRAIPSSLEKESDLLVYLKNRKCIVCHFIEKAFPFSV